MRPIAMLSLKLSGIPAHALFALLVGIMIFQSQRLLAQGHGENEKESYAVSVGRSTLYSVHEIGKSPQGSYNLDSLNYVWTIYSSVPSMVNFFATYTQYISPKDKFYISVGQGPGHIPGLHNLVAQLKQSFPHNDIIAGVSGLSTLDSLAATVASDSLLNADVTWLNYDYEPNFEPEYTWNFDTTLMIMDSAAQIAHKYGKPLMTSPTSRPLLSNSMLSEEGQKWNYYDIFKQVDVLNVQTQASAKSGTTTGYVNALDTLIAQFNGGTDFIPQISLGTGGNGTTAQNAYDCAEVTEQKSISCLLIWAGAAQEPMTQQFFDSIGVRYGPLSVPLLSSPANGAISVPRKATFAWMPTLGATVYELQIAADSGFSKVVVDTTAAVPNMQLSSTLAASTKYYWRVAARNSAFTSSYSPAGNFTTGTGILGINSEPNGIPSKFSLHQNYPNPFNPSTTIAYQIPTDIFVTLKVYDVRGDLVKILVNNRKEAGNYEVSFYADQLPTGVYFYWLRAGKFSSVRKMLLLK